MPPCTPPRGKTQGATASGERIAEGGGPAPSRGPAAPRRPAPPAPPAHRPPSRLHVQLLDVRRRAPQPLPHLRHKPAHHPLLDFAVADEFDHAAARLVWPIVPIPATIPPMPSQTKDTESSCGQGITGTKGQKFMLFNVDCFPFQAVRVRGAAFGMFLWMSPFRSSSAILSSVVLFVFPFPPPALLPEGVSAFRQDLQDLQDFGRPPSRPPPRHGTVAAKDKKDMANRKEPAPSRPPLSPLSPFCSFVPMIPCPHEDSVSLFSRPWAV